VGKKIKLPLIVNVRETHERCSVTVTDN